MNSSTRVKDRSSTSEAEQRPFSSHLTHSKSRSKRPPSSPGRRSAPQDSPPIDPHTSQTPPNRPAHTYTRRRDLDNSSEKDEEKLENDTEEEDEHEDALQALASYMAFQRTLLRHIEIDPTFTEFSDRDQASAMVESMSLHSVHCAEGFMQDSEIGKGKQPEHRF